MAAGSVDIAILTALLLAHQPKFLPLAVLPLLILRYLGEGHFYARNDRVRLRGLFEAALDVNRSMGGVGPEQPCSARPGRCFAPPRCP